MMVAVNKSLGRVEEIKRAMIKNRGKRDQRPQTDLVTCGHAHVFFLSFLVFKRIKIFISIPNYN